MKTIIFVIVLIALLSSCKKDGICYTVEGVTHSDRDTVLLLRCIKPDVCADTIRLTPKTSCLWIGGSYNSIAPVVVGDSGAVRWKKGDVYCRRY